MRSLGHWVGLMLRQAQHEDLFVSGKEKGGMASHSPFVETNAGVRLALRLHRDFGAAFRALMEADLAVYRGEDGVILAESDIAARVIFCAALAQDDIARQHILAAVALDAEAPAGAVAPVARTAACFLVCHGCCSLLLLLGAAGLGTTGLGVALG